PTPPVRVVPMPDLITRAAGGWHVGRRGGRRKTPGHAPDSESGLSQRAERRVDHCCHVSPGRRPEVVRSSEVVIVTSLLLTGLPARATSPVATRISRPNRTARISPRAINLRTVSGEQLSASATSGTVRYAVIGVVSVMPAPSDT